MSRLYQRLSLLCVAFGVTLFFLIVWSTVGTQRLDLSSIDEMPGSSFLHRLFGSVSFADGSYLDPSRVQGVPDYFQTSPELYPGPTKTGAPAFLAQTNPAPFPSVTYIPPQPLETQVPIQNAPAGGNIYQLHGQLSHYFPNPVGFGVDEHPIPRGANIVGLHMLHRHGARYPTSTPKFAYKIANNTGKFRASGKLAFLNEWTHKLGEQILVPVGKQELFDSGTLHQYLYGHLYPNDGSKIVARSTTQDRMTQSAEYFLAGFFGLEWPKNATLELIIEQDGFNNSLAGYDQCNNSNAKVSYQGSTAQLEWAEIYLKDAMERLNGMIEPTGFLNLSDLVAMQSLCAYETVGLGYSAFCDLFTYEEWEGYEYGIDLSFAGNNAFQSPTGRAVGIGWVEELRARLMHHYIKEPTAQINVTLDSMPSTFPLNQTLYFDFSHDTNIMSILTAMGLTQFAGFFPADHMIDHELFVSHLEPFAARLDIEIIEAPHPISDKRQLTDADPNREPPYSSGGYTTYLHMLLNQRTIPLGKSLEQCGERTDGWCELDAFLNATSTALRDSQYDYACNGEYPIVPYGSLSDGVPPVQTPTA